MLVFSGFSVFFQSITEAELSVIFFNGDFVVSVVVIFGHILDRFFECSVDWFVDRSPPSGVVQI